MWSFLENPVSIFSLPLLIGIAVLLIKWHNSTAPLTTTKKLPPSPPKWPVIGNLHQLGTPIHHSFMSLAKRYGDSLMLLYIGSVPTLVVSSTEAARAIMQTHDIAFANRIDTRMFRRLTFDLKEVSVAPYGEYWRQAKSILTLHLLSNKKVQSFDGIRDKIIADYVNKITKCSLSNNMPTVDLSDLFSSISNDISCMVAFGRTYNEGKIGRKFKKILLEFNEVVGRFYFEDSIPQLALVDRLRGLDGKVERVIKDLDEFYQSIIDETISKSRNKPNAIGEDREESFIETLLRIQKEDTGAITMDEDVVKALIQDAYIGGTDTTSSVLVWVMTELLLNPNILNIVQDEIRSVLKGKKHITNEDMEKMKYLKAVIMETSRLHPPVPLLPPRSARHDVNIMGYDISKDTRVYVNAYAIMRDPRVWDKAESFMPERFLESCTDFVKHNFELLTFGAGRRSCPGRVFAMAISEKVLANFLYKFQWSLPNGVGAQDVDMNDTIGLTTHKKVPLLAIGTPFSP